MFSQIQILKTGHFVLVALLAIVGPGLLVTNVHAQTAEELGIQPKTSTQIDEMIEMRESIGGSILGGLDLGLERAELDKDMDRVFREELERLAKQQIEQEELNRQRAQIANASLSTADGSGASQGSRPFVVDSWEKAKAFYEVACQLEQAAWQLEQVGAYDAGASLRARANELRQKARTFKG